MHNLFYQSERGTKMAHVVTKYQWAWRSGDMDFVMNWCGEMSEKGWELKGMSQSSSPQTVAGNVNIWTITWSAFMQRPILVDTNLGDGWQFPD